MESQTLTRLRYAHEHLFRLQSYCEAKNATVASANLVILANIQQLDKGLLLSVLLLLSVFLCCFVSALIAFASFFPNIRNLADEDSAVFFVDTAKRENGHSLIEDLNDVSKIPSEETDLAHQITIVSKIVKAKTSAFSNALIWFAIGASVYVAGLFIQELTLAI